MNGEKPFPLPLFIYLFSYLQDILMLVLHYKRRDDSAHILNKRINNESRKVRKRKIDVRRSQLSLCVWSLKDFFFFSHFVSFCIFLAPCNWIEREVKYSLEHSTIVRRGSKVLKKSIKWLWRESKTKKKHSQKQK